MFQAEVEKIAPGSVLVLAVPSLAAAEAAASEPPSTLTGTTVPYRERFPRDAHAGAVAMFLDWFALSECNIILQVSFARATMPYHLEAHTWLSLFLPAANLAMHLRAPGHCL